MKSKFERLVVSLSTQRMRSEYDKYLVTNKFLMEGQKK